MWLLCEGHDRMLRELVDFAARSQGVVGVGSRAERLLQGLAAAARWLGKPKSMLLAECYISAVSISRRRGKTKGLC
jgi:hypothetical protein